MVVKAKDMKKKGEEQIKKRFEKDVTSLEAAIGREIGQNLPSRAYAIPLGKCVNTIDKEVLSAVMEHYRQASWNVEYNPEGRKVYNKWEGTRHYHDLLELTIQKGSKPQNAACRVIHASVIEEKVKAKEAEEFEQDVKRYEEAIDSKLEDDCESAEIWHDIRKDMNEKMKKRIKEIYEKAGWQVQYKRREVTWNDGHIDVIPYILFKRQD